ncbi:MAG: M1 family metallopeptidase, partial [Rhodospirillaceae bacterium]
MTLGRPLAASGLAVLLLGGGLAALAAQGPGNPALAGSAPVEQTAQGARPALRVLAAFDGLGADLHAGDTPPRNPSDNSLAVGPDHIVQTVNSRMAIFTKKGRTFDSTGRVLYGPVNTNQVFKGFGGTCEAMNNGDAVVRYDQLANRWLIVMPIFRRAEARPDQPAEWTDEGRVYLSPPGRPGQPGPAALLVAPDAPAAPPAAAGGDATRGRGGRPGQDPAAARPPAPTGPYAMCYAVSTGPDPFGPYYRYEFLRPLFPDYPRPAVWPDGYYVPTSTGDDPISDLIATQKHACVADRARMLRGEPATEQCIVLNNVGFLNNADVDGPAAPPPGAPNVMMAAGGVQLRGQFEASHIDAWQFHVDWADPSKTAITGPARIPVAPYRYLCDGQLTNCVPQPGTDRRLDAQGDKIMSRLVYRRLAGQESIVGVHSVNTSAGGGGVRWYEFRVDPQRRVSLFQQGTFAPDGLFRWMASPAIDGRGNIGIGYSFGGAPNYAGQRFAARLADDPPGRLTLREAVLADGEASQPAMRWQDYTQTAIDPSDDCTIWYVGDYLRKDATAYSTKIGAFRLPGCPPLPAGQQPAPPAPRRPPVPAEPTPADILRGAYGRYRANNDLLSYDLEVRVDPLTKSISGTNRIRFRMLSDDSRIQLDLVANLRVDGITLGTRALKYEREFNAVFVDFPERLKKGSVYEIAFRYSGTPPETGRFGGIAFRTDPAGRPWINTACQHIGASVWWPNKDQYRDEVEQMYLRVAIPSDLVDVSNGKFLGKTDLGDGYTRWDWHIQYPINNYSVSLNIGHYVHFSDEVDGQTLDFYCLPENLEKAKAQFAQAKTMMRAFQEYIGPYPFPKDGYKLIEAPYSGMEHQSAVTYGNRFANGYLGRDWTGVGISTTFDFIIVHESAHEWFGNAVTASDVCDEWIHEAWGTYAEGIYVEYVSGKAEALKYLNGYTAKVRNREPIVAPCGVNRVPPQDMYFKGALFINTLRSVVDDDQRWWRIVRAFFERFKYQTIATSDVVAFFNAQVGTDLTPIFDQYLRHPAIPVLELRFPEAGGPVSYRWKADAPGFAMPVKVGA